MKLAELSLDQLEALSNELGAQLDELRDKRREVATEMRSRLARNAVAQALRGLAAQGITADAFAPGAVLTADGGVKE